MEDNSKDTVDSQTLLERNAKSFSKFGTFCAGCERFGVGRHPGNGQHGIPVGWTRTTLTRAECDQLMRESEDWPIRKYRQVVVLVDEDGDIVLFVTCEECSVIEGASQTDPTVN
jgi:hypothetical protein